MDACPECGGLLIQDDGSDDFLLEPVDDYYCPGCGWSTGDEVTYQGDDEEDYFQRCSACDGHDACADFGCARQLGLGHLVQTDSI